MGTDTRTGIILELDEHCIETTARNRYQSLMTEALENEVLDSATKTTLEILRTFLEQVDFPAIRSENEELCGDQQVRVLVYLNQDGRACWSKL